MCQMWRIPAKSCSGVVIRSLNAPVPSLLEFAVETVNHKMDDKLARNFKLLTLPHVSAAIIDGPLSHLQVVTPVSNCAMRAKPNVWIIDDEISVLRVTEALLASLNEFELRSFQSAAELLSAIEPNVVDCVVSDIAMPEIDGSKLQRELLKIDRSLAMVFLSGKADIPTTVELMRRGAVTLLEKPFQAAELTEVVRKAIQLTKSKREHLAEINEIINKIRTLDSDEIDVLFCIVAGLSNKTAAYQLSLSARTFDRRRQRVFQVMQVDSPAELATKIERCRPHLPADLEATAQRHSDKL